MTIPRHYDLHVSPLHAKVTMITYTNAKKRQTWGNESDAKSGLADVGLYAEQMLSNRHGG